jgi:hypothetical protein
MLRVNAPSLLLLGVLLSSLGCGMSAPRTLKSVSVAPVMADAKDFPGALVQFTATGVFTKPPSPVTPLSVAWQSRNVAIATIGETTGLAQCVPGQSGSVTISIAPQGDGPLQDVATLTCP